MTRQQLSENSYLSGLCILVAAMPLSVFMMSVAQFVLLGSWIAGGNIPGKIKAAFSNPAVAVLATVYFMHLVAGFYSTDYDYFYHDVRIKLPLLAVPVLMYTSPKITVKWFEGIMGIFVLAVLTSTIISMGVLYDIFPHKNKIDDIRNISVFVSHIRLSLFICVSFFTVAYFLWKYRGAAFVLKASMLLLLCWFLVFLYILEAMTGVAILIITSMLLLLYLALRQKNILLKIIIPVFVAAIPLAIFGYIKNEAGKVYRQQVVDASRLEKTTLNGNTYEHLPERKDQENGNMVWLYICEKELATAWNKRSKLAYDGADLRGHQLKYTLIRFLASKGLRKDSAGVSALSESEIHAIEKSIANVEYQKMGSIKVRIHKTIWEYYSYKFGENPTGQTMMQRIEYWKAGWNIFKHHPWLGVGTGDVQKAFDEEYVRAHSPLAEYARHRAHNQYLTFALTFGMIGFLFFIFSLFYPMFRLNKSSDYFYVTFLIIALVSMLTEDTLETQAGVTFFAFFNSFFLFARKGNLPIL